MKTDVHFTPRFCPLGLVSMLKGKNSPSICVFISHNFKRFNRNVLLILFQRMSDSRRKQRAQVSSDKVPKATGNCIHVNLNAACSVVLFRGISSIPNQIASFANDFSVTHRQMILSCISLSFHFIKVFVILVLR